MQQQGSTSSFSLNIHDLLSFFQLLTCIDSYNVIIIFCEKNVND